VTFELLPENKLPIAFSSPPTPEGKEGIRRNT